MANTPLDVRLQQLIAGWQGGQRGEPLTVLHTQCMESVGRESPLLPARVYFVNDLDAMTLRDTLKHSSAQVRFQVDPDGRFDAALVPIGRAQGPLDRFVFAVEATLPTRDQHALYAHTVGHLLLNEQARLLERGLNLDPDSGFAHWDRLAVLRYVETVRNLADRRVLEGFPTTLTKLIEPPAESSVLLETTARDLQQRLTRLGWDKRGLLVAPYTYTDGRVLPGSERRLRRLTVDVLLRASSSLPIAVVHGQRAGEALDEAQRRVQSAAMHLRVPFAFLLETNGRVQEFDYSAGGQPISTHQPDLPAHDELVARWLALLQLNDAEARGILFYPYEQRKIPRYYQDAAINQALIALVQARRGQREKRVLLTLATGTGKTRVAFQLLWKLKQTRAVRNVLFLADRTYLLNQAANNEFAPFGEGIWRAEGEANMARDLVFASYQWLTTKDRAGLYNYEKYEPGYFDVVIIDECHRGSASEDSAWRKVLAHFASAVQIGLTATPLDSRDVQTRTYFGEAVYRYSLSRGINDGFLAPYRVRRVLIGPQGEANEQAPQTPGENALPPAPDPLQHNPNSSELAEALVMETANTMRRYTRAIAEHLAQYLQQSDPRAKTIVFCVNNEHAAEMRAELQRACAAWTRPGEIVRVVDDDGSDGKLALDEFCSVTARKPVIVTTSKLLSTGIDAPMCKNIVLARGVGSMVEFKQIIGRGTRLSGREKTWFTILDYAGAIKHFFDPDFDGNPESIINEILLPPPATSDQGQQADGDDADETDQANQSDVGGTSEAASPTEQANETSTPAQSPVEGTQGQVVGAGTGGQTYDFAIRATQARDRAVVEPDGAQEHANEAPYPGRPSDLSREQQTRVTEQPGQLASDQSLESGVPGSDIAHSALLDRDQAGVQKQPALPPSAPTLEKSTGQLQAAAPIPGQPSMPVTEPDTLVRRREDGVSFVARGEMLFELGTDGRTLNARPAREWAKLTLQQVVSTPEELRARWGESLQRAELVQMLDDQVVPLETLAATMHLTEADPLDMLLQAVFGLPALTRPERVARLRELHASFFQRFAASPLATRILDAILDWYMHCPVYSPDVQDKERLDVSNTHLLELPAIAPPGGPMEVALAFQQCGINFGAALKELKRLLYSV